MSPSDSIATSTVRTSIIEAIDVKLGGRIEYRQRLLQSRNPLRRLCLRHWGMQFDTDGGRRLARLLHATAL